MAINGATIRSNTWSTIKTALEGLYATKTIYAKFPESNNIIKKSDYPILVIKNPAVSRDEKYFGVTRSSKIIETFIEVYSTNPEHMDTYGDTIMNHFETTKLADLHISSISDSDTGSVNINNKNVHFKIINITSKYNG